MIRPVSKQDRQPPLPLTPAIAAIHQQPFRRDIRSCVSSTTCYPLANRPPNRDSQLFDYFSRQQSHCCRRLYGYFIACRKMVVIDDIGLNLDVLTPYDATPESKLPVLVVSFQFSCLFRFDSPNIANSGFILAHSSLVARPRMCQNAYTVIICAYANTDMTVMPSWRNQFRLAFPLCMLA